MSDVDLERLIPETALEVYRDIKKRALEYGVSEDFFMSPDFVNYVYAKSTTIVSAYLTNNNNVKLTEEELRAWKEIQDISSEQVNNIQNGR